MRGRLWHGVRDTCAVLFALQTEPVLLANDDTTPEIPNPTAFARGLVSAVNLGVPAELSCLL